MDTACIVVPVDVETDLSADVAQHNVVVAVDVVRRQADFLTVHINAVGAALRRNPGS